MWDPPMLYFDSSPNALYTYMVEDVDLINDRRYFHYIRYNIPGNMLHKGDIAFDWIPSFMFNLRFFPNRTEPKLINDGSTHAHLHLVYRQPGRIRMDEFQIGCTEDIATGDRIKVGNGQLLFSMNISNFHFRQDTKNLPKSIN